MNEETFQEAAELHDRIEKCGKVIDAYDEQSGTIKSNMMDSLFRDAITTDNSTTRSFMQWIEQVYKKAKEDFEKL